MQFRSKVLIPNAINMNLFVAFGITLLFLGVSTSAFAKEESPPLLSLGAGIFNVDQEARRLQLQAEYRSKCFYRNLRYLAGVFVTQNASLYVCAGLAYDIYFGKRFVVTPSFAPGVYFRGNGKDLGYPLEFRSSMEVAYVLNHKGRIGAQFYHISNASLGYKNPGEESLIFFYSIPLGKKKS